MQYALRFPVLAAVLIVLAIFLLPHMSFAAQITITMTDNSFTPRNITINPGDTVTWVNQGAMAHTATADNGSFDGGTIQPGQNFGATFNAPGVYAYHCKFHGSAGGVGMAGTITVAAANTAEANSNSQVYPPAYTNSSTNTNADANPSSAARLQAQAQALLNQIDMLKRQLGVSAGAAGASAASYDSSSCPLIGGSLRRGSSGESVSRLQQFLARDTSVYPEGIVSGYFGALTERAVQRWQVKYNVVSTGSPETTGFGVVGPRTAAAIALLCAAGSYSGVGGPSPVGGYITVSPISGAAPLAVKVVATVNTTNSCSGATYTLDYGDGSPVQQIPVSAGNCAKVEQGYPHVYQYGGTYQIKLSAGSHETSATVTVSGPPAPVFTPGLPRETFTAAPTSGAAPLTVTFAGTVNSNDAGFCDGGCASILDFGDGTSANVDLPAAVGGWLNYSVPHTYSATGGFRATLFQGGAGRGQPIIGTVTIIVGAGGGGGGGGGNYSYSPPAIAPSGTNLFTYAAQFDLPSSCTGFDLSWGDGSAHVTQSDGGSSCTQSPAFKSFTHTYSSGGSYTILLKRGPTLSRSDDFALTISN